MSLPLAVDSLIDDFNLGPLNCTRRGVPTLDAYGEYDPAVNITVVFNPIAAHTAQGRDLLQVPEADRNTEITKFYTRERMFVADALQAADVMTYNGRDWRMVKVKNYATQGNVYIGWGALVEVQA
jgi:hypothetical protein